MSIVDLKKYIGLLLLLLCSIFSKAQQRPNVILIYSDDQGAIDLNCYGSKDLETPHIDKLAKWGYVYPVLCLTGLFTIQGILTDGYDTTKSGNAGQCQRNQFEWRHAK